MEQELKSLYIPLIPLLALLMIQVIKPSHAFVIDFTLLCAPFKVLMLQKDKVLSRRQKPLHFAVGAVVILVSISTMIDLFFNIEGFLIFYYLVNLHMAFLLLYIVIRFFLKTYTNPSLIPDIRDLKRIFRNAFLFLIWCAMIPPIVSSLNYKYLWLWLILFLIAFSYAEFAGRMVTKKQTPLPYKQISQSLAPVVEDHINSQIIESLKRYLIHNKGCLNKRLTEQELAVSLGTNRCYLSRTVNGRLGYSLPAYINRCRVYFACRMMIENPEFTNNYISECCGFAASSTFNNSFKKTTGKTPHVWRREAMIVKANTGKYEYDVFFKDLDEQVLEKNNQQT